MLSNEDRIAISLMLDDTREKLQTSLRTHLGRLTHRFHDHEKHINKNLRELDDAQSAIRRATLKELNELNTIISDIQQRLAKLEDHTK